MRVPRPGDIWLVNYPYITPGNMEKIRPAIIRSFEDDDTVVVQKLTTKKKWNTKKFEHPKMKKDTYISKELVKIKDYNLVRYIGNLKQGK